MLFLLKFLKLRETLSTFALLIFVFGLQTSICKASKDGEIGRSIEDGFNVPEEDEDNLENMIKSNKEKKAENQKSRLDARIVQGETAAIGTKWKILKMSLHSIFFKETIFQMEITVNER